MTRTSLFSLSIVLGTAAFWLHRNALGSSLHRLAGQDDARTTKVEQTETAEHADKSSEHSEHPDNAGKGREDGKELKFDAEAQEKLGIACAPLIAGTAQPEIRALGTIQIDPASVYTLRAPLAGVLVAGAQPWPALGATISPQAALAGIRPRLTPVEQFTLVTQAADAQAAVDEIETELAGAQASFDSKRRLNADGKVVSDRQYEEAETRLRSVEARLHGAQTRLKLLKSQLAAVEQGLSPFPLLAEADGVVQEILAAPGEVVDAGQPLLRLIDPGKGLAAVELPLGQNWSPGSGMPRVALVGHEESVRAAKLIGPAPHAGMQTHGASWLLSVSGDELQPGAPIVAYLPLSGEPRAGVLIPAPALLRHGGLTWVFVREGDEFARKQVELVTPMSAGWLATGEVKPGDEVVIRGAQLLLSQQLKSQIEAEAEAAE